jgi:hypothetical protein
MKMPWETPEQSLEDIVQALRADMQFMHAFTAILVRSQNEKLRTVVNTERGQVMPEGKCTFKDGTTIEFQDIGMPQIGMPAMTVQELVLTTLDKAFALELELS